MTFTIVDDEFLEEIIIARREGFSAGYRQAMTDVTNFLQARIEEQVEEGWSG